MDECCGLQVLQTGEGVISWPLLLFLATFCLIPMACAQAQTGSNTVLGDEGRLEASHQLKIVSRSDKQIVQGLFDFSWWPSSDNIIFDLACSRTQDSTFALDDSLVQSVVLPSLSCNVVGHVDAKYNMLKVEHGLIVGWQIKSEDQKESQVAVYTIQGQLLIRMNVLGLVPEAMSVSIDDVAVAPARQMMAVAAVYSRGAGTFPSGSLLYFDLRGHLLSTVALRPSRSIDKLAFDENNNIWTLTSISGGLDPSKVPMVVEYSPTGTALKELLKRSEFPPHETEIREDSTTGVAGFGYDGGTVWFWLPDSTDFVTVKADDGSVTRTRTGAPKDFPFETPITISGDSRGLAAQMLGKNKKTDAQGKWGFFLWSSSSKSWARFETSCGSRTHLIGLDQGMVLFTRVATGGSLEICSSARP